VIDLLRCTTITNKHHEKHFESPKTSPKKKTQVRKKGNEAALMHNALLICFPLSLIVLYVSRDADLITERPVCECACVAP
jgi:hypothetical protein